MDEGAAAERRTLATEPGAARALQTSPDDLRITFRRLADTWHDETGGLSSPSQIATHPAYQRIIEMGEQALPLIFDDLQERGGQWYVALRSITRASPVPPEVAGRTRLVREAWLQWGREHGYCR